MANIKEQAAAVNMLPNARLTAAQVINSVFKDGAYANIALGKALSKQNHSEQDRRFVTELVYGTVKAKGTRLAAAAAGITSSWQNRTDDFKYITAGCFPNLFFGTHTGLCCL